MKKDNAIKDLKFWNPIILPNHLDFVHVAKLIGQAQATLMTKKLCKVLKPKPEEESMVKALEANFATFKNKLALVRGQILKTPIAPALCYPQAIVSPENGFTCSSELIPNLFWMHDSFELKEGFKEYWPISCTTGKPMRWVMSVNLGYWHFILSKLTNPKGISPYGGNNFDGYIYKFWFHIFTDYQDTTGYTPDCAIIPDFVPYYDERATDKNMFFKKTETSPAIKLFMAYQNKSLHYEDVSFNPPCDYLGEPTFLFQLDDPKSPYNFEDDDPEKTEEETKVKIFGRPESQQEPKRFISPNRRAMRACVPVMSCVDGIEDSDHQFYADLFSMREFEGSSMYCKWDRSCT